MKSRDEITKHCCLLHYDCFGFLSGYACSGSDKYGRAEVHTFFICHLYSKTNFNKTANSYNYSYRNTYSNKDVCPAAIGKT